MTTRTAQATQDARAPFAGAREASGVWSMGVKKGYWGGLVEAPVWIWRVVCLTGLVLALAAVGQAQTVVTVGPVDTSMKFAWSPGANVTTVAEALTFEYRLRDSTFIPVTAFVPASVVCAGTPIACHAPMTLSNADAINRVGMHVLTISAWRKDVGDSQASLPFSLPTPAAAPTNFRLIR